MKFSYDVIIPCYKGKIFIDNCISQHINQTLPPKNIIFVNDGDNSFDKKYIEDLVNSKTNLIYIKNSINIGAINSINLAIKEIKSRYFKISAIDDKFDKNLAQQTIDFFVKHPDCGIAMSYPGYYIHEKFKKINISYNFNKNEFVYYNKFETKKILKNNFFKPHSQTIFFKTDKFLKKNLFLNEFGYMADLLNNYYIMLNHGFCIIPKNLSYYGLHKSQWSSNINRFEKNFHIKILNYLKLYDNEFYNDLKNLKLYVDLSIFDIFYINSIHKNFINFNFFKRIFIFNVWNYLKTILGVDKIYKIYNFFN